MKATSDIISMMKDLLRRVRILELQTTTHSGINSNESSTDIELIAGKRFIPTHASTRVVFTLPITAKVGDTFYVTGFGAGGWKLAQNSGQTIHGSSDTTTTGTGGYLESSVAFDAVEIVCVVANTDFVIANSEGTITVV